MSATKDNNLTIVCPHNERKDYPSLDELFGCNVKIVNSRDAAFDVCKAPVIVHHNSGRLSIQLPSIIEQLKRSLSEHPHVLVVIMTMGTQRVCDTNAVHDILRLHDIHDVSRVELAWMNYSQHKFIHTDDIEAKFAKVMDGVNPVQELCDDLDSVDVAALTPAQREQLQKSLLAALAKL